MSLADRARNPPSNAEMAIFEENIRRLLAEAEAEHARYENELQALKDTLQLKEHELWHYFSAHEAFNELTPAQQRALAIELELRRLRRLYGNALFLRQLNLRTRSRLPSESPIAIVDMPEQPNAPSA